MRFWRKEARTGTTGEKVSRLKGGAFFLCRFLALVGEPSHSMAQGLDVTNLDQLVVEAYNPDYCLILPSPPTGLVGRFGCMEVNLGGFFVSQMSCTHLFQSSTELDCGVTAYQWCWCRKTPVRQPSSRMD